MTLFLRLETAANIYRYRHLTNVLLDYSFQHRHNETTSLTIVKSKETDTSVVFRVLGYIENTSVINMLLL